MRFVVFAYLTVSFYYILVPPIKHYLCLFDLYLHKKKTVLFPPSFNSKQNIEFQLISLH